MSIFGRTATRTTLRATSIIGASYLLEIKPFLRNDSWLPSIEARQPSVKTTSVRNENPKNSTYRDLCMGSVTGLFFGTLIGKFSSLFIFLALLTYLGIQFLEQRGLIRIPWKRLFSFEGSGTRFENLMRSRFYFNTSFSAAFLIAAFNI